MTEQANEPVFAIGRMVSWLVVTLMLASAVYAAAIAALNWRTIGV